MQAIGEFVLTEKNMRVPDKGKIYSINEGYTYLWDEAIKEYVRQKKDPAVGVSRFYLYICFTLHGIILSTFKIAVWQTIWSSLCRIDGG